MDTRAPFVNTDDDGDEKQCRACLVKHSNHQLYTLDSKNLTTMNDGSAETIAEIYHQCTQLLYVPTDDHCKWICQYCVEKMVDFYQFRKMCIESYSTLRLKQDFEAMAVIQDNSSLKMEIIDEYNDTASRAMQSENNVDIKQKAIFNCNLVQSNDDTQIVEFNSNDANVNVSIDEEAVCFEWVMPLQETESAANVYVQNDDDADDDNDDIDNADADFELNDDDDVDSSDSDDGDIDEIEAEVFYSNL